MQKGGIRNKIIRKTALWCCVLLALCTGCAASGRGGVGKDSVNSGEGLLSQNGSGEEGSWEAPGGGEDDRVQIPDFEMTLCDGSKVSFGDFRGKKVLLNFWATWCGPCVGEMPAFQKLSEEYPEELVILAVNCSEDQATVRKFVQDKSYTFPVVPDTDGAIQRMFGGITSIPVTVIIDEEGYIVTASVGARDAETMYKAYKEALGL